MNMNGIVIIPVYQPEPVLPALVNEVSDNGNFMMQKLWIFTRNFTRE